MACGWLSGLRYHVSISSYLPERIPYLSLSQTFLLDVPPPISFWAVQNQFISYVNERNSSKLIFSFYFLPKMQAIRFMIDRYHIHLDIRYSLYSLYLCLYKSQYLCFLAIVFVWPIYIISSAGPFFASGGKDFHDHANYLAKSAHPHHIGRHYLSIMSHFNSVIQFDNHTQVPKTISDQRFNR